MVKGALLYSKNEYSMKEMGLEWGNRIRQSTNMFCGNPTFETSKKLMEE